QGFRAPGKRWGARARPGSARARGGGRTGTRLPADADSSPNVYLNAIACPSATICVAAGTYTDNAGEPKVLLVTDAGSGTSWTAAGVPLPADAGTSPGLSVQALTCPSATSCVATGYYTDSASHYHALLVTGFGTSWTVTEAPVPANAASHPDPTLSAVACSSETSCVAVGGYYTPQSASPVGLLVTGSGTSWTATEAPLPANAIKA